MTVDNVTLPYAKFQNVAENLVIELFKSDNNKTYEAVKTKRNGRTT